MNNNVMKWVLSVILLAGGFSLYAAPVRDKQVEAELISKVSHIQPGVPFELGLRLTHDPHWHTYWLNDGDSGLPTRMKWELPEGFSVSEIQWPYPERLSLPPLMSYGYEGVVLLLFTVTPPADLQPGTEVTLGGKASWLMCKEICIPGKAALSLNLPVRAEAPEPSAQADQFTEAERRLPLVSDNWSILAEADDQTVQLTVTAKTTPLPKLEELVFFPFEKGVIENAPEQVLETKGESYQLTIPRAETVPPLPDRLRGVLVSENHAWEPGRHALLVDIPWGKPAPALPAATRPATATISLPAAILFAFIGGLILNLMPCVFPVISLKILGFVQQAGEHPKQVRYHGLMFAAGVMISFWILAGILLALRAGGAVFGWGFQLSNPTFLVGLIALFYVMALNLFGVFEIGVSLTSAGQTVTSKGSWSGSFFSGVLATVIATPCSAPLMGAAVGFALTQPASVSLMIFSSLGFGMAFPYLLLTRFPALLMRLPKPGAWMETMKQSMGFILAATVVWLFWVLSARSASSSLPWVMVMFLLLALASWIYGRWGALH
ncbi:MAG: thiol:disulfide interchange protein, partial [Kiritimatiellae bacterium]|nr:thiol:disulfide interchange protein [Kiritimatiellia bacterium]